MEKGCVHYCCVAKGGRILQAYSGGDHEIEKLAALCLERAPAYHRWYSQTMGNRTFVLLMEDGFIYFAIANDGIGNSALLRFLEHIRNEFRKITKKGLSLGRKGSVSSSNLNSVRLQEQLVPIIHQLITSLQNVSQTGGNGNNLNPSSSPNNAYLGEVVEVSTSTKAPLLGNKSFKQEKKTKDHHMIAMRGIELEEHRASRGDSDPNNSGVAVSPIALQKDMSPSMRMRSQSIQRKWCRVVSLVLAIDVAVCIVLFLIWLLICQGLQCVG